MEYEMTNPNNNMNAYKQALQINRDLKRENDKIKDVLIFTIQSLDGEFSKEVQSKENTIGLIRHKIDEVLNGK
jgi:hydroxypyruvate isomerase